MAMKQTVIRSSLSILLLVTARQWPAFFAPSSTPVCLLCRHKETKTLEPTELQMRYYQPTHLSGDTVTVKYLTRLARSPSTFFAALVFFVTVLTTASPVCATQPLALKPLPAGYSGARLVEYTGYSATGRITRVIRNAASVVVIADKPHWGRFRWRDARIALWPADTQLILHVAAVAPITIDGKKAGFDQLAVGQTVSVQYSIVVPGPYCAARRIEGWTTAPAKTAQERD